jgi:hypothetical protein
VNIPNEVTMTDLPTDRALPAAPAPPAAFATLAVPAALAMPAALVLLALLALEGPGTASAAERYEGIAYVRGTDRIAYRETHWLFDRDGIRERLVLYQCADRTAFGRKWLREVPSAVAPDFDFEDALDGYREGVRTEQGARLVYVRENARAEERTRPLPASADGVVDAGFDAFVREHWQDLVAGRDPRLDFLIPSRFEYLPFALSGLPDTTMDGEPARRFKLKLAGWYGFVLPGIDLTYDREGRLLEFDGVGNVRDAAGKNQNVRIVFPAKAIRSDVPQSEIAHAAAEPLVSRCKP